MMQSEKKITRNNALEIIKKFAKEYRKVFGKEKGEIIIVGGGSIMLNYGFRDATQDFDVILRTTSGIKDVIRRFADENELPRDWMNSDFMKTDSYSEKLAEVSEHYCTLNNGNFEIRTVAGEYLIAMKLRAHRAYRNDISDAMAILIEEYEMGNVLKFEDVISAYKFLYNEMPDDSILTLIRSFFDRDITELRTVYEEHLKNENQVADTMIRYMDNGAVINVFNVNDVISKIKDKMK